MKCKKCKKECEKSSSGLTGGWEYWYCMNFDCEIGKPNLVPQHLDERNYNTLERRLEASAQIAPVSPLKKKARRVIDKTQEKT